MSSAIAQCRQSGWSDLIYVNSAGLFQGTADAWGRSQQVEHLPAAAPNLRFVKID